MEADPYCWDVEQVQEFFRHHASTLILERPNSQLPAPDTFLAALAENEVNGATLLENIDSSTLRDDFDIRKLGTRGAVLYCIQKLRSRSSTCCGKTNYLVPQSPRTPGPLFDLQSQKSGNNVDSSSSKFATPLPALENKTLETHVRETEPFAREGEVIVTDSHGQKRRRVALHTAKFQSHKDECVGVVSTQRPYQSYLRDRALSLDQVFFGTVGLGQELAETVLVENLEVLESGMDEGLADDNFQFYSLKASQGEARFIYGQMRHFMAAVEKGKLVRNGRAAMSLLPYRNGLQRKARSAMVLQFDFDRPEPIARRELAAYITSSQQCIHDLYNVLDAKPIEDEVAEDLEFLANKFGTHDGCETTRDEDRSSIATNDSEEDMSDTPAVRGITLEDVTQTVDDTLQLFADEWQAKLSEHEAKNAWKTWKKMKNRRNLRDELIKCAERRIQELNRRLNKMISEIRATDWQSKKSIVKSCGNLEPTVHEIQEQQWKISIWERREQPPLREKSKTNRMRYDPSTQATYSHRPRQGYVASGEQPSMSGVGSRSDLRTLLIDESRSTDEDVIISAHEKSAHIADDNGSLASSGSPYDPAQLFAYGISGDETWATDHDDIVLGGEANEEDIDEEVVSRGDKEEMTSVPGVDPPDSTTPGSRTSREPESDELPALSQFVQERPVPAPPLHAGTENVIDLTLSSDSETIIPCQKLATAKPCQKLQKGSAASKTQNLMGDPKLSTAAQITAWDIKELSRNQDRQRILIKLLSKAGAEYRDRLHILVHSIEPATLMSQLSKSICEHKSKNLSGDNRSEADLFHCAGMYLAWLQPSFDVIEWAMHDFASTMPNELQVTDVKLLCCPRQIELFLPMLLFLLGRKNTKMFSPPTEQKKTGSPRAVVISSDDNASGPHPKNKAAYIDEHSLRISRICNKDIENRTVDAALHTPHKKRKRKVATNAFGDRKRKDALDRQKRYATMIESQASNSTQLAAMMQSDDMECEILINPAKDEGLAAININPRIAKKLKAHQIDGIRFLWREVTTADDSGAGQGCVLAHAMGLGKSMQTLALLSTLDDAAQSVNPQVFNQLPNNLRPDEVRDHHRRLRTLLLCPPSLIQNWHYEVEQWVGSAFWNMYSLEAGSNGQIYALRSWMNTGGIMLVGYQMFRNLIQTISAKEPGLRRKQYDDDESLQIQEMLLKGAEIVIADEAHNLKNQASATAKSASRIETQVRVALTGTPISNDVQEIYALVSWVAPGYLGDSVEFRARYTEPIAEGLYEDSTAYEKRRSIMKLKVLHHEIEPKVNRATIEALRGSLKNKVEFVLTVPLTEYQIKLYRCFVRIVASGNPQVSQARLFGWLAMLILLTNHPHCFRQKLIALANKLAADQVSADTDAVDVDGSLQRQVEKNLRTKLAAETTLDQNFDLNVVSAVYEDGGVQALGLSAATIQDMLGECQDDDDVNPILSTKTTVFLKLLDHCIEYGDKVLVFSSSIPTLEYLDALFVRSERRFGRIDGSTQISQRNQILLDFHKGRFEIMLISTRAGGVGLNITAANRVFIFDFGFNPAWEEQAIGRAYRIGQTKPVYVYRFVAGGTFETKLYNTQLFKSSLARRVVDKKNPRRTAERKTNDWLHEPGEIMQKNFTEWIGKDKHVLDRLIKLHGSGQEGKYDTQIREIRTMETLQQEALDEPLDQREQKEVDEEIAEGRGRRARKPFQGNNTNYG